jgi:putative acetyltransferase
MAVAPEHQRKSFGSALVETGLEQCRQLSYTEEVVLGHPRYYPRFGFSLAFGFGIKCEYNVSDEVFMAVEQEPKSLSGKSWTFRYHSVFNNV